MAGKKHYHVEIRRNGAHYGTFGPYAKRADALADAGSLGAPGVKVAIVSGSGSSCPSCPGKNTSKRRNTSVKAGSSWVLLRPITLRFGNRIYAFREEDTVYVEKVDKNGKTVHISHDGDVPGVVPLPVDGFLQIAIPSEDYYRRFYAADGTRKNTSKRRKNTSKRWIQKATAGSKEGVFTAQAKRAGYPSALAFAKAIMKRWKAGHKSVKNKKTGKMQRVTVTTMRRANLALNMQKRKAPAKRRNTSKTANRRKSKPTSYNLPPPLARR